MRESIGMQNVTTRAYRKAKRLMGFRPAPNEGTSSFFVELDSARAQINGSMLDIEKIFFEIAEHNKSLKWLHYLRVYDRILSRYRGTNFKMLEIGVFDGLSLQLWRRYFGEQATIFGIDINPDCATRAVPPTQVRIGSQDDPAFLNRVVAEMGGVDVVLDDGSHLGRHQTASFRYLFPKLPVGGLYIIEDLHTAYWPDQWEGGYRRPGTGIELVKSLVDDLHGHYHSKDCPYTKPNEISSITVFDSICVIEKGNNPRPMLVRS